MSAWRFLAWLAAGGLGAAAVGCGEPGAPLGPSTDFSSDLLPSTEEPLDRVSWDAELPPGDAGQAPSWPPLEPPEPVGEPEPSPTDAGADAQLPHDPGPPPPDPFAVDPVCTSGSYWPGGTSEVMHPGVACIACHSTTGWGRAPEFRLAGTLYPTAHEPDDCNAALPAGARIEIRGADGRITRLEPNEVGNFFTLDSVALPYTARVVHEGRARAMLTPQSSGDCNSCHTQDGAGGAPGRILLP